ncbi:alginate export family protein [Sphingomonas adhaesiva]|uniref:alginate export family protein n=1 Tax=Sphingomonas adhaesiva TaxID=28212 RepID=UPI002FF9F93B
MGDRWPTGRYSMSRWAEDWRIMADPEERRDPVDRLKFLPIAADGAVYVTLSGEVRVRVNYTDNPQLRDGSHQRQDILRLVGGADLHIGDNLRLFGEVAHGGLGGLRLGDPPASLRNRAVLQQGFAEYGTRAGVVELGARVGRQEFEDGANLLVASRDNNTIRFALDGVRLWARTSRLRLTAFDLRYVALGRGGFGDDRTDRGTRFSGITAGVVLPTDLFGGSALYVDPFLWRVREDDRDWSGTPARESRIYAGARIWGEAGRVSVEWTLNHQRGRHGARPIRAWQALMEQTVALSNADDAPEIGFHLDYASGGGGASPDEPLRATSTPFGNNIYYSYGLFLTPSNLVAFAPIVRVQPARGITLTLEHQWAWRPNDRDSIYRANTTHYVGTARVRGHRIARLPRAQLQWTINPRLSFLGRLEYLDAQEALTRAGYTDSAFAAGWVSYRF